MKAVFFLKKHVSGSFMIKCYATDSLRQFTKTLNQFFFLSGAKKNLEICKPVWFAQLSELKQFWGTFMRKHFNIWTLSEKHKIAFSLKITTCEDITFIWLSPGMKQPLKKLHFEFPHTLNFSCTWNKETL